MLIDLRGKVALVTGAGRGIGREIALTLAGEGVRTIAIDVNEEHLADLNQVFAENGFEGFQQVCDIRDFSAIEKVVQEAEYKYGRIDILVNNAGVASGGLVETMSEEIWDLNLDINLKGTFLMCKAVLPIMKRQKYGRIINAASFAAIIPSLGGSAYATSKAGVVHFTRVLAGELGPWNITVNCYAPGVIPTDMNRFADRSPQEQKELLDNLSLRRWGNKQEIAHLICFLASDFAVYITGTMIDISGGKLATQVPRLAYEWAAEEE
ncbi:SDR family NAD(P)-dependent oxidoreductase [Paenibacillus radicis (ex Xue et al. 2023)]|uniref:SDR family oxidoreductase n=1 Tax=Paenibacillus radicis (ex Xue et al. 2023) TaxID=2972489 RepID=A0ABT1YE88_9BACL|nr:SDR family NAD(P)-dependent oxidoreductase [Paenibacillus radicis (ex Xue et al. 2023)]MCR8631507.1 SDR family oxidoreductase [Paenibacillus radicis (ex Xue et al. 2023)]